MKRLRQAWALGGVVDSKNLYIRESAQFNITTVSSKVIRQEAARVWSERVSGGCILSYFARDNTISSCSTSGPKAVDTNFIRPARVAFSSTYSLT